VALHQLRRAPRLLFYKLHQLYINLVVRHDYSSPGRTSSTSTSSCTVTTHLQIAPALHRLRRAPRVFISRLQRLYFNYAACSGASAPHAAHRQLLQLHRAFGCLGCSRNSSSTTSHIPCVLHWLDIDYSSSGCTGSTVPMSCIRTRRLAAQLLTGSTSTTSCAMTTRLPAAAALHQPCCASRLLISRQHRLHLDNFVRCDYSST
jgi:hypothetical protein